MKLTPELRDPALLGVPFFRREKPYYRKYSKHGRVFPGIEELALNVLNKLPDTCDHIICKLLDVGCVVSLVV